MTFTKGNIAWNKGKPRKWISGSEYKKGFPPPKHKDGCKCFRCQPYKALVWNKVKSGDKAHAWTGGKRVGKNGYVFIYISPHVYKYEHRVIMEKSIGRKLNRLEIVHHKDFNRTNNSLDNLQIMTTKEHNYLHRNHKAM